LTIRPFRRFPVHCFAKYDAGSLMGVGTVWNLSMNGWRLSGNLSLQSGDRCSLTVHLPNKQRIFVAEAFVRWARENEYGIETQGVARHQKAALEHYVKRLKQEALQLGRYE
jgi:hypothetical protein